MLFIASTKKDAEGAAAAAAAVSADQVAITSAAAAPSEEECPICMEMCPDVQRLKVRIVIAFTCTPRLCLSIHQF